MTKISILGCGWLGQPLAEALVRKGFLVNGSTTSSAKLPVLEKLEINPFEITLSANEILGNVASFLNGSDILIINIPPKLRRPEPEDFVSKIKNLIPFVENSFIKHVLFVSSISVYADNNSTVTELTLPQPESESGRQLWETEQLLHANTIFDTTILRFGGLIGEDRHPIKSLAGRKNISNPDAPVNLIDQKDCIRIILTLLENDVWNETFNAVAPFHPTRKHYYTQCAAALQLPLPEFDESKPSFGKTIATEKIISVLKYTFEKPNL